MKTYEKDKINFHGSLNLMRQMHNATMEQVCEGICSRAMMKRIETGERLPDKLTRDRLMQRMGAAQESYQDYLMGEEYEAYELRGRLLDAIEEQNPPRAQLCLTEYEDWWKRPGREEMGRGEEQFLLAMKYQLYLWEIGKESLLSTDLSREEENKAKAMLQEALELTLGKSRGNWRLLAEPELHLMAEYLRFLPREEALSGYRSLLNLVEERKTDRISRVKIIPILIYYRLQKSKETTLIREEWEENFELCEKPIQSLLGSGRNYFLVELISLWEECYGELKKLQAFSREKTTHLQKILKERKAWKAMFLELYNRFGLSAYRNNFAYLYRETRSCHIGEVIKIRRGMLGLSREGLCEGICSLKTLTRLENKKAKTQMPIVRQLMQRLGLNPEYIRARVFTNEYQIVQKTDLLGKYLNTGQIEEATLLYLQLKQELCIEIPENRQYLKRMEEELKLIKEEISSQEFIKRMEDILEITVKKEALQWEEVFLSRQEKALVYRMVMSEEREESPYIEVIRKRLQFYRERGSKRFLTDYEFLLTGYCSYLGNRKRYEESNLLCEELILDCLQTGRIMRLEAHLYNLIWNKWVEHPDKDKERQKQDLNYCIYLSRMEKNELGERFFKKRFEKEYKSRD